MSEQPFDWNEQYATKQTPWDSGQPSRELERVLDERQIRPGRALEIGCGTGTNAVYLASRGFDVTAFDLSAIAIERAKQRAAEAGLQLSLFVGDVLNPPDLGEPFDFVFDRGVYHSLRPEGLLALLKLLERTTRPGSLYLTLAGNANEVRPPGAEHEGPPQVHAHDLCKELQPLFDLIQLREFRFDGVEIDGRPIQPLAWSAMLRRR